MNNNHYFHPSLLSQSYINNIFLPFDNVTLFVNVYDSESSVITESISCSIQLQSHSVCIDHFDQVIMNNTLSMSEYDTFLYILQQSLIYLQYLKNERVDIQN